MESPRTYHIQSGSLSVELCRHQCQKKKKEKVSKKTRKAIIKRPEEKKKERKEKKSRQPRRDASPVLTCWKRNNLNESGLVNE